MDIKHQSIFMCYICVQIWNKKDNINNNISSEKMEALKMEG